MSKSKNNQQQKSSTIILPIIKQPKNNRLLLDSTYGINLRLDLAHLSNKWIQINQFAIEKLRSIIENQEEQNYFLRISANEGFNGINYILTLDTVKQSNNYESIIDGVNVKTDMVLYPAIVGTTIDYDDLYKGFILINSNTNQLALSGNSCSTDRSCNCISSGCC